MSSYEKNLAMDFLFLMVCNYKLMKISKKNFHARFHFFSRQMEAGPKNPQYWLKIGNVYRIFARFQQAWAKVKNRAGPI